MHQATKKIGWAALLLACLVVSFASAFGAQGKKTIRKARIPAEGAMSFTIHDAATGNAMPGKLSFVGVKGTAQPSFGGDIGREEFNVMSAWNRAFTIQGEGVLRVPVGTYDVYATRGPEWSLDVKRSVTIRAGKTVDCDFLLRHVVATPGWASADFHVHAAHSPDSKVPMRDRVYEFIGDGVDMIVATDHNVISDYAPTINELGATGLLASSSGDEVTTATWGHFGVFPLPAPHNEAEHAGALAAPSTAVGLMANLRATAPDAVIDVHHPRLDKEIGYFNRGEFDAKRDVAGRSGFSFDFDAVEVLNGYQDPDRTSAERVIKDWFALLDHGHLVTGTGNSDTHHLSYNLGGYPRNYVRVAEDAPDKLTPRAVAAAVKAHRLLFTTGPFVGFHIGAADIGDLVAAPAGLVTVTIEVDAPAWMKLSRATLLVNGQPFKTWTTFSLNDGVRLHSTEEVKVASDAYLIVRVDGDTPMAPVVGDAGRFPVYPFAITNPIFVDVNNNGRFDAPLAHGTHGTHGAK